MQLTLPLIVTLASHLFFFAETVQANPGDSAQDLRIPSLPETLPEVNRFIEVLNAAVQAGTVKSNFDLVARVWKNPKR